MTLEEAIMRGSDERENHYVGMAARIGFAVTSVATVCVSGWFVFSAFALDDPRGLMNAALAAIPAVAGMAVFTTLTRRWKVFLRGRSYASDATR
ncbi:MAG: hypothetical protein WC971_07760 [Coriobacteriia bacterium]